MSKTQLLNSRLPHNPVWRRGAEQYLKRAKRLVAPIEDQPTSFTKAKAVDFLAEAEKIQQGCFVAPFSGREFDIFKDSSVVDSFKMDFPKKITDFNEDVFSAFFNHKDILGNFPQFLIFSRAFVKESIKDVAKLPAEVRKQYGWPITLHYALLYQNILQIKEILKEKHPAPGQINEVELFPGVPENKQLEILSHLIAMQIIEGCKYPCNFCALDVKGNPKSMAFKYVQALLNASVERYAEIIRNFPQMNFRRRGLNVQLGANPIEYSCPETGADLSDVNELAATSPIFNGFDLVTAGWGLEDKLAQAAAERLLFLHMSGSYFIGNERSYFNMISRARVSFSLRKKIPNYQAAMANVLDTWDRFYPDVILRYVKKERSKAIISFVKTMDLQESSCGFNLASTMPEEEAAKLKPGEKGKLLEMNAESMEMSLPEETIYPAGRAARFKGENKPMETDERLAVEGEGYVINLDGTISYYRDDKNNPLAFSLEPTPYRAFVPE